MDLVALAEQNQSDHSVKTGVAKLQYPLGKGQRLVGHAGEATDLLPSVAGARIASERLWA